MGSLQNDGAHKVPITSDKPGVAFLPSKDVNAVIPNPVACLWRAVVRNVLLALTRLPQATEGSAFAFRKIAVRSHLKN